MVMLRTIQNEDIDRLAQQAMLVTIDSLVKENLLSNEDALKYVDTHICTTMDESIFTHIFKKIFGDDAKNYHCVILKIIGGK